MHAGQQGKWIRIFLKIVLKLRKKTNFAGETALFRAIQNQPLCYNRFLRFSEHPLKLEQVVHSFWFTNVPILCTVGWPSAFLPPCAPTSSSWGTAAWSPSAWRLSWRSRPSGTGSSSTSSARTLITSSSATSSTTWPRSWATAARTCLTPKCSSARSAGCCVHSVQNEDDLPAPGKCQGAFSVQLNCHKVISSLLENNGNYFVFLICIFIIFQTIL